VTLAVINSSSAGRVYNVGESHVPTMAERLADFARVAGWRGRIIRVAASALPEGDRMPQDFVHHLVYDTARIRAELGHIEVVPSEEQAASSLGSAMGPPLEVSSPSSGFSSQPFLGVVGSR